MSRPVAAFAQRLNLEPEAVRTIIAAARRDLPWYVELGVGIGAWIAGLFCVGGIFGLGLAITESEIGVVVLGLALIAGGIALRGSGAMFRRQFGLSIILAGQVAALVGVGMERAELWPVAILAAALTLILLPLVRDAAHQFVSVGIACGCLLAAMVESGRGSGALLFATVALVPGMGLLLWPPPRLDLRAAAHALLLAPLGVFAVLDLLETGIQPWTFHLTRAAYVAAIAAVLGLLWREADAGGRIVAAAAFVVAAAIAVTLPLGLTGALLLLLLAYALGSPALAVVGALAEVFFLGRFYYSLQLDLMAKSELLAGAGVVLLVLWLGWRRMAGVEARP